MSHFPRILPVLTAIAALGGAPQGLADDDSPTKPLQFREQLDGSVIAGGRSYSSWEELGASGIFRGAARRCGSPNLPDGAAAAFATTDSDCGFSSTNPVNQYAPANQLYRIPVVVHVIMGRDGVGYLSEEQVLSQIDVLNEDFLALPGSNGAAGTDVQIEFALATVDPGGADTQGITYTTNDEWFSDRGNYFLELAWDPNRYLNIYTNNPGGGGLLGYVSAFPQQALTGTRFDRVVILYSAFGRNAPLTPYDLGRTTTHEVGHYLGLFHTFEGSCGVDCTRTGDLICDTEPQVIPTFGCPRDAFSCNSPDPIRNYMDYSDDICMNQFTQQQARRMRCALVTYRPQLFETTPSPRFVRGDVDGDGNLNITDASRILQALFLKGSLGCKDAADTDDSGSVDLGDALHVLNYLFLSGPALASSDCQADLTEDSLDCERSTCELEASSDQ